jgi:hypothetical protein
MSFLSGSFAAWFAAVVRWTLAALAAVATGSTYAALGEPAASVHGESVRYAASLTQGRVGLAQVHTLSHTDGSRVRQYSGADGSVFAVAWSTRTKPRLNELLGTHFAAYVQAAQKELSKRPGVRHALVVQVGDLVVESSGHGNAFFGRAYLRSRLPATARSETWR